MAGGLERRRLGVKEVTRMRARHTSTEQIVDLILRGEKEGWLPLSEVERLGDGLPQEPLEALYERLEAHGIDVRDDCGRASAPLTGADGALAAATVNSLWLFVDEIPPPPLLTAGEELELAMAVERGDRWSKERMINSNLRLVASIAKRYQGRGLPLLDLIRAGILGLVHAVETFDWRPGHRFSAYATWCVLQAVHRLERDEKARHGPREHAA
jgi:RNA polymerase primary sigma factor